MCLKLVGQTILGGGKHKVSTCINQSEITGRSLELLSCTLNLRLPEKAQPLKPKPHQKTEAPKPKEQKLNPKTKQKNGARA